MGESVVETDAARATRCSSVIRRARAAADPGVQPQPAHGAAARASPSRSALRRALSTLRLSIHNTIGIGDAENDHDLLDACEVGVAVEWGSPALRTVADEVIAGHRAAGRRAYLRRADAAAAPVGSQMGRRRLLLGHQHDGQPVHLAIRGRTVLIAGEPGSGKSWLAGLLCEQLILQGYCVCVIDPEGDYRSLEALPGVVVLGGDDPPPRARELAQALRYPDISVVIDLVHDCRIRPEERVPAGAPAAAATLRRQTGLPAQDSARRSALLSRRARRDGALIDAELAGYILVTYRVSGIDEQVRTAADTVVMVTRETDPQEQETLRAMCEAAGANVPGTRCSTI